MLVHHSYLLQFRDLELQLRGTVLGMLKLSFETLRAIVAFDLFFQLADPALKLLDLISQLCV